MVHIMLRTNKYLLDLQDFAVVFFVRIIVFIKGSPENITKGQSNMKTRKKSARFLSGYVAQFNVCYGICGS